MKKCVLFFVSVFPVIVNISFAQEAREQQAKKTEVWSPVKNANAQPTHHPADNSLSTISTSIN